MSHADIARSIRKIVLADGRVLYEQAALSQGAAQASPHTPRPDLPGSVGRATPAGAGLSSPLSEPDASTRTYYDPVRVRSSHALFTVLWRPIKSMDLIDAAGRPVRIEFAKPLSVPDADGVVEALQ